MAIREFKISGVFGVVHELSTPSKLLPLLPAALLATLTFKLYIVNFVFGSSFYHTGLWLTNTLS